MLSSVKASSHIELINLCYMTSYDFSALIKESNFINISFIKSIEFIL